ncbi:hypothetical protein ANCDUO_19497 [Ancylostoma duodenale]|uniref:Uncharacterized protein n=1 Tax=Ancylostoma duodenale TaxID=51022 RepID=A0A0C2C2F5_9BILA|nr:hypothetical protein ANCDUO_19497 [Ancylostoma duodenale]
MVQCLPRIALAHVHSLNVNLRKFLLFSGMTCLVWTRDRHAYKDAFTTTTFQRLPMQGFSVAQCLSMTD